jgi:hypothetical protein
MNKLLQDLQLGSDQKKITESAQEESKERDGAALDWKEPIFAASKE